MTVGRLRQVGPATRKGAQELRDSQSETGSRSSLPLPEFSTRPPSDAHDRHLLHASQRSVGQPCFVPLGGELDTPVTAPVQAEQCPEELVALRKVSRWLWLERQRAEAGPIVVKAAPVRTPMYTRAPAG